MAGLLLAELIVLEVRFDTMTLIGMPQWWAELVSHADLLPHVAITVVAATLVFAGPSLRKGLLELPADAFRPHRQCLAFLAGHFVVLAAFAGLTAFIFEGGMPDAQHPWVWLVAWATTGLSAVVLWAASVLPLPVWRNLVWRAARPVFASVAVGTSAILAGHFCRNLWHPLASWTFAGVRILLAPLIPGFFCDPVSREIGSSAFRVSIAPACSGYEGIGLVVVLLVLYLWSCRRKLRMPQSLMLLPLGVTLVWLCNVIRIAVLVCIGTWCSPEVARGGFHSQAGWLAFNAVALGLIAVAGRSSYFCGENAVARFTISNAANPYLVPFLVLLAVQMVTAAIAVPGQPDWYYPLRVISVAFALWIFRDVYRTWQWSWSWQAVAAGIAVALLWVVVDRWYPAEETSLVAVAGLSTQQAVLNSLWWLFRVPGYIIAVPVVEELAFRGYLMRRLIAVSFDELPVGQFSWFALLVSSMLFGLLHGSQWIAGTLAGMVFACVLVRRGRIADAVLAHATANGLLAACAAMTGNWRLLS